MNVRVRNVKMQPRLFYMLMLKKKKIYYSSSPLPFAKKNPKNMQDTMKMKNKSELINDEAIFFPFILFCIHFDCVFNCVL